MNGQTNPRQAAVEIVERLRARGHVAYFAGGCVRDELLGLAPDDYDVATDARVEQVRELFRSMNEVGAAFGVMLVRVRGVQVEVATFREESGYSDRRRPDRVAFSTSDRDARRRDFTINALFLDPLAEPASDPGAAAARVEQFAGGRIIDHVGGLADLEARMIRAVGEPGERLAEDHLRALRAVRFTSRLAPRGFRLDGATAAAIREHASELGGVSRERIGQELRRMFLEPSFAHAAALMDDLRLSAVVLDEPAAEGWGSGEPGAVGRLEVAGIADAVSRFSAVLGAWLLDRWPAAGVSRDEVVARVRPALCLTNEERDGLRAVLSGVEWLESGWESASVAVQKRAAAARWFPGALAVVSARGSQLGDALRAAVSRLDQDGIGVAPAPLVTGDDLVRMGIGAGPGFGRLLDELYDAQLEGRIRTRDEALARASRRPG